jgi:superfamily II DNA or RNA helicase
MSEVDKICLKYDFPFAPLGYQRDTINAHIEDCIDRVGLYWSVGAGKTFASTLLNLVYRERTGAQILQITPPAVQRQWSKWLTKCGISHVVYAGTPKQRAAITFDRETKYVLMTIDILKRDFDRVSAAFEGRPLMVCVDEATSIKNYESGSYRAITQISSGRGLVLMTGTPISTPKDTYAYVKLLSPECYRSYKNFENIHVGQRDFFNNVTEWVRTDLMKQNLALRSSFISTPEANPDMPRARISEWEYELSPHHMRIYKELVNKQLLVFESGAAIDASTPQTLYHNLQQIVLSYGYFAQDESLIPAGFAVLDQFLEELGEGKLVVFANYKRSCRAITEHLLKKGIRAVQVNGDVSQAVKDANVETFKEDPACRVLVANPKSGGVGIDGLQLVSNSALFMESPTIPAEFKQAVGRLERPGARFEPDIRIATAVGTIQMRLKDRLLSNDEVVNTIVPSLQDLRAVLLGK